MFTSFLSGFKLHGNCVHTRSLGSTKTHLAQQSVSSRVTQAGVTIDLDNTGSRRSQLANHGISGWLQCRKQRCQNLSPTHSEEYLRATTYVTENSSGCAHPPANPCWATACLRATKSMSTPSFAKQGFWTPTQQQAQQLTNTLSWLSSSGATTNTGDLGCRGWPSITKRKPTQNP